MNSNDVDKNKTATKAETMGGSKITAFLCEIVGMDFGKSCSNLVILDGIAGVGTNTIAFASSSQFNRVIANEISQTVLSRLKYNLKASRINSRVVSVYNKNIVSLALSNDFIYDILYLNCYPSQFLQVTNTNNSSGQQGQGQGHSLEHFAFKALHHSRYVKYVAYNLPENYDFKILTEFAETHQLDFQVHRNNDSRASLALLSRLLPRNAADYRINTTKSLADITTTNSSSPPFELRETVHCKYHQETNNDEAAKAGEKTQLIKMTQTYLYGLHVKYPSKSLIRLYQSKNCGVIVDFYSHVPHYSAVNGQSITLEQRLEHLCTLKTLQDVFARNKIAWMLYTGSVVGALMFGQPIPWDDDLDIATDYVHYANFCSMVHSSAPDLGCSYKNGTIVKIFNRDGEAIPSVRQWKFPFVDVFFYNYSSEQKMYRIVDTLHPNTRPLHQESTLFPTHLHFFAGLRVPLPHAALDPRLHSHMFARDKCTMGSFSHRKEQKFGKPFHNLLMKYLTLTQLIRYIRIFPITTTNAILLYC